MANVRVYELAKELGVSNHDLMTALSEIGVAVKSHASTLSPEEIDKVKPVVQKNGSSAKAPENPVAPESPVVTEKAETPAPAEKPAKHEKREIVLPENVSVKELAGLLGVPTAEVQKSLVKQGALIAVNQVVAPPLAKKVTEGFGFAVVLPKAKTVATAPAPTHGPKPLTDLQESEKPKPQPAAAPAPKPKPKPRRDAVLTPRPPIVTILGHVDHGKTTLLDAIRDTSVTDSEFGGITQHIGAYQVEVKGKKITFLDTPGHAAFTAMRARGAQVTDIAVLIVAADDGMMPQTIEALDHARAAEVQIIAVINKVDKADADVLRVKQQLAEHNLVIEEWGGDTVSVDISAKNRVNIDELLEMILLVAELQELKADTHGPVEATVIEAKLDRGKGPLATVLVKSGTLKKGDAVIVGPAYGRIKAMMDDHGSPIDKAGPATPVEIVGLSTVPLAGDHLEVLKNEREARQEARVVSRKPETRD